MRAAICLVLLGILFSGCGYKGALYLPKAKPEAQKPAPKSAAPQEEKATASP